MIPTAKVANELVYADELPQGIAQAYKRAKLEYSDIYLHVPWLRYMASRCNHVTEFGVRSGVSTTALIAGLTAHKPGNVLRSYDINVSARPGLNSLACAAGIDFELTEANTITMLEIEPTDMLFVDTFHTHSQVALELEKHGKHVRRWIAFHDTKTFGTVGEDGGAGIRGAIQNYVDVTNFEIVYDYPENNGMMCIARV